MIQLPKKIIIAIDGYSSCGKSSYAKLIARELSYIYLDSGAMYRSVALFALQEGMVNNKAINIPALTARLNEIKISFSNLQGENCTFLNGNNVERDIRGVEVSQHVSSISKIPEVRKYLVSLQQEMGAARGIVMDGRDIGTVVFPDAELKIFMTADIRVRTQRRYDELKQKGIRASREEIRKNINERDEQDIHRTVSPLKKAGDAVVLDNSHMTFDDQMVWFRKLLIQKGFLPTDGNTN